MNLPSQNLPVVFISHGSPMQAIMATEANYVWTQLPLYWPVPKAILVISAHWESELPLISSVVQPETIHDFGGFPKELYTLHYPAPGAPQIAQHISQLLLAAEVSCELQTRGLDHGAWVPLRYLYPNASIPVLQLSVQPMRDAYHHYRIGQALKSLASEGVLILASGHATHNLSEFFLGNSLPASPHPEAAAFRDWLYSRITERNIPELLEWNAAPGAMYAHPSPEHLFPLFVALGAAGIGYHSERVYAGWEAPSLALDSYVFSQP